MGDHVIRKSSSENRIYMSTAGELHSKEMIDVSSTSTLSLLSVETPESEISRPTSPKIYSSLIFEYPSGSLRALSPSSSSSNNNSSSSNNNLINNNSKITSRTISKTISKTISRTISKMITRIISKMITRMTSKIISRTTNRTINRITNRTINRITNRTTSRGNNNNSNMPHFQI